MSKLYIFAIGGTGSRVLRSLTMLLAAGVKTGADHIVPIIIDPDQANADLTRSVTLMNNYASLRQRLTFGEGNQNTFFRPTIDQLLPNYTLVVNDTNDRQFRQFINLSAMSAANQAMAQMLFSEQNLHSSMSIGFKGNPNIGSVVLNQIPSSPGFDTFANSFQAGDRIFIVSSIFGGTGASGFPLLLKTLRHGRNFANYSDINHADIGAITILPYFRVETSEESEIDSSTFISKAKSALAYYEKNISRPAGQINALYYLADDLTNIYANNEGGTTQKNDAHIIELFAASAIVDFSNSPGLPGSTVHKELGLRRAGASVSFADFDEGLTQMLRAPMTQMTLLANGLTDKFQQLASVDVAANKTLGLNADFYRDAFVTRLRQYLTDYRAWLAELKSNRRSLDLFNLEPGDEPFNSVTGVKPQSVKSLASNYSLYITRLNKAAEKCASKEKHDRLLEAYSLATARLIKEKFNF